MISPMTYVIWGSLILVCASIGAIMWYRFAKVQYAFVFLGLSLFAVPTLLGYAYLPSIVVGLLLLIIPVWNHVLRTPSTSANSERPQRLSHYPFLLALASVVIGGLAFIIGLGAAFSRAGNWSNYLAEFGIVLFFVAALSNIVAFEAGCISLIRGKLFHRWLPFSFVGLLVTIYSAWVAVHL